jgi:hypothetical protein
MRAEDRRILQILAGIIVACAILYVRLFIPGHWNGSDFAPFYAGAVTDAHGGDPYVFADAWKTQKILFFPTGYSGPPTVDALRNPPPFTLLLRAFTGLTQDQAYWPWVAIEFAACCLGIFAMLTTWPLRARFIAAATVSLSPVALWNIRVGQVSMLLALSFGLAVYLVHRGRPGIAGAVLSVGLVKPHLLLPLALVLFLAAPDRARRLLALGFLAAVAAWVAVGVAFDGGMIRYIHYLEWLTNLGGTGSPLADQGDIAAIPGLFYELLPSPLSAIFTALGVAVGGGLIVLLARNSAEAGMWGRTRLLGAGIVVCFAFLPYEHTSDQILLALPLLLLIGPDGSGFRYLSVRIAAFACVLTPLVLFHDHTIEGPNVLPSICLMVAYALVRPGQVLSRCPLSPATDLEAEGGAASSRRPALALE